MTLLKKLVLSLLIVVLFGSSAWAADFVIDPADIPFFPEVVDEAARLTAYRSMVSAEPGGLTGFDIGVAITGVEVDSALWSRPIGCSKDAEKSLGGVKFRMTMVRAMCN